MQSNRSMPSVTVIPVLAYDDVPAAADWLCRVFGFAERLRIADHRVQLTIGAGAVVVASRRPGAPVDHDHAVMVRVADVDTHCARAEAAGARILQRPTDFAYGERQCTVVDPWNHVWTFSQTLADVDPRDWGGVLHPES